MSSHREWVSFLQLCQHPVYKICDNDIRMGIMRAKISNYAFHPTDTGFRRPASRSSFTANSKNRKSISPLLSTPLWQPKGTGGWTSRRYTCIDEFKIGMRISIPRNSIIIGRYPFISVIEPPMNATLPVCLVSNLNLELSNEPRIVIFCFSNPLTGRKLSKWAQLGQVQYEVSLILISKQKRRIGKPCNCFEIVWFD